MFKVGATVRTVRATAGMPASSAGIVIGWYTNTSEVVVSFWDGGPLRVTADDLELVEEPAERLP